MRAASTTRARCSARSWSCSWTASCAADRSVVDLLTADYTYINEQLALLYGIDTTSRAARSSASQLHDAKRYGLLGKGAVLMLTANPNRTAPVLRGAWILERILRHAAGLAAAERARSETKRRQGSPTTVRERTEIHRRNPACASCHGVMDPLGFALENFDTVGQFRTVDPQTAPADRHRGDDAGRHAHRAGRTTCTALAARGDQFVQTITEKLMTYAVGRHIEHQRHADRAPHRARGGADGNRVRVARAAASSTAMRSVAARRRRCRRRQTAQVVIDRCPIEVRRHACS